MRRLPPDPCRSSTLSTHPLSPARIASRTIPALAALALACSGGGGGGPSEPRDTVAPPVPAAALVRATLPAGGATTVTGDPGAVEAAATVIVTNASTGGAAQAAATPEGAFSLQLQAAIGDPIRVTARDAAGNESAPLALSAGPAASAIRLSIASGDGQIGVRGRPLPDPLRVRVTASGAPLAGVPVRFAEAGGGSLSATTVTTDGSGFASATYALGPAAGPRTVHVEVLAGGSGHAASFALEAVDAPVIESVTPAAAPGGATLTITGRNFSPVPGHTVVSIEGSPAAVVSATRTAVQTTLPYGLSGEVAVQVSLTGVSSGPSRVRIVDGPVKAPPVGHVALAAAPSGAGAAFVPFETGAEEYVIAIEAPTRDGFGFSLIVDGSVPVQGARAPLAPAAEGPDAEAEALAQGYRLLDRHGPARPAVRGLAPADTRSFWVINVPQSRYESRPARLEYDGPKVAVYVDEAVPAASFPTDEARALGRSFESSVYAEVRSAYGSESDLDRNGKPIIFLTPMVNVRSSSEGTLLGFFSPGDLAEHPHTNRGEIFYLLVPDTEGQWGPPTPPASRLRNLLVSVAAHEFVHMINANERTLVRGLPGQEYWLEEGLAHYGEQVAGRLLYGNVNGYLRLGSAGVSLVGTQLLTRGAATLFVARLVDRFGIGVLRRTVTDPGRSVATVEGATGRPWAELFHDWTLAMYNELYPVPGLVPRFDALDVAGAFSLEYDSPLKGNALGIFDRTLTGLTVAPTPVGMREGAVAFLRVRGGSPGQLGEVRFQATRSVGLQTTTIRIR